MDRIRKQRHHKLTLLPLFVLALVTLAVAGCRNVARTDPATQATATAEALAAVEAKLALAGTAWEVAYFFEPAQ